MHVRRAVAVTLAVVALTLLCGTPAWAHATLQESTPADTTVVAQAPADVTLHYDEPVSTALGAVKVLAPDGARVDADRVTAGDGGRTVVAALRPGLPAGTYTVLWRVLSVDNHTIFGSSTFSVGAPSATTASTDQQSGGTAAEDLLAVTRLLLYAGLLVLVGALGFVVVLWPAGRSAGGARRLLRAAGVLTAVGTIGGLLLQGPYAAGLPLSAVLDPTLLRDVLGTGYGIAATARLALLAALAVLLRRSGSPRGAVPTAAAAVLAVGLLVSTSVVGHAKAGDLVALTLPADVLHLAAGSAWVGGLALLALVLLRRRYAGDLATVLPRWSRYATGAVAVLVVTGTFAGWAHVREWGALVGTRYGWLLLAKTGLVAAMLVLAALGRRWVQRRRDPVPRASPPALDSGGGLLTEVRPAPPVVALRRSVVVEAALAVVVLAVTAVLVETTPARNDWFPPVVASATVVADLQVRLDVAPARSGLNTVRLTYTSGPAGRPTDVVKASARWVRQSGGDDVVPVRMLRSGPGRYSAGEVQLPAAGPWQLAVTTQTSDIDATTTLFTVRIR